MDILLLSFSYVAPFIVYLLLGIASKRLFSTSSKSQVHKVGVNSPSG